MDGNSNYPNDNYQNNYQNNGQNNYGGPIMTPEEAPMTMGQWLIVLIVAAIPCVNIIMLLIWGFSSGGNVNRKNYCRAQLIILAIGIVLMLLSWGTMVAAFANLGMGGYY
jgi:hypothetical protein